MEITRIQIQNICTDGLCTSMEGVYHQKQLPCLSVVQATEGRYDVQIPNEPRLTLKELDVFAAPPNVLQRIWHHDSLDTKRMQAHWMFFSVIVNDQYDITDLYDFPVRLPPQYNEQVLTSIGRASLGDLCTRQAVAFELMGLLLRHGTPKPTVDDAYLKLKSYILEHLTEREALTTQQMAHFMHMSAATFYRSFKRLFGMTSSSYIRTERLSRASFLLATTSQPVGAISSSVGFYDHAQFDSLFRQMYGVTPSAYRRSVKGKGEK